MKPLNYIVLGCALLMSHPLPAAQNGNAGSDGQPSVSIRSPRNNSRVQNQTLRIGGQARPKQGTAEVLYKLNDGEYQAANGTANWSATVTLEPGENVLSVKSVTTEGMESAEVSRTIHYIPKDQFNSFKGSYNGLVTGETTGFFTLTVSSSGRYSGKLTSAGQSARFIGQLEPDGSASTTLRSEDEEQPIQFAITPDNAGAEVTGNLGDGSQLAGHKQVFSSKNRAGQAGEYNLSFNDGSRGQARFRVDQHGRARLQGRVTDGPALQHSAFISSNGAFPVYVFSRAGETLIGWIQIDSQSPVPSTLFLTADDGSSEEIMVTGERRNNQSGRGRGGSNNDGTDDRGNGNNDDQNRNNGPGRGNGSENSGGSGNSGKK